MNPINTNAMLSGKNLSLYLIIRWTKIEQILRRRKMRNIEMLMAGSSSLAGTVGDRGSSLVVVLEFTNFVGGAEVEGSIVEGVVVDGGLVVVGGGFVEGGVVGGAVSLTVVALAVVAIVGIVVGTVVGTAVGVVAEITGTVVTDGESTLPGPNPAVTTSSLLPGSS